MAERLPTIEEIIAGYRDPDKPYMYGMISLDDYLDCHLNRIQQHFHRRADPQSHEYFCSLPSVESDASSVESSFVVNLAGRYCARDPTFTLPPRPVLRELLVACKKATLGELESLDKNLREQQAHGSTLSGGNIPHVSVSVSTLQTPLLHQLIISLTLTLRNKALVRAITQKY
jgi:hypothetical protein